MLSGSSKKTFTTFAYSRAPGLKAPDAMATAATSAFISGISSPF
jgi:hypothetical protein